MQLDIEEKPQIPNATTVLVLGILSIVLFCFFGWVLGIIGIILGNKSRKLYSKNPTGYRGYGSLQAGWIMSIIGLCVSGMYFIWTLIYFLIWGSLFMTIFSTMQ